MPELQRRIASQRWLLCLCVLAVNLIGMGLLVMGSSALYAQEATPKAVDQVQVSPYLSEALATGGEEVQILILLKDQPDLVALQAAAVSASASHVTSAAERRTTRIAYLYHALTAQALASQSDLRAWLDAQGIPYRAYYIINMIYVMGGADLVEALRQRTDIARLDANPQVDTLHLAASVGSWTRILQLPEAVASPNMPYGISATRAPEVWAMGYTGQGITVASQDTGVEWEHPALRSHYRGVNGEVVDHTYNWLNGITENGNFDACAGIDSPCDDNGHGTHTVGTMIGTTDAITYGVAPDAQWMGCRNMRSGIGTPASYTTCFEFFLAPYPPGGDPFTDGRPELAPDIINNSWGCPPSEGCNKDSLRQVVETVRAAGLMVVASAGNKGPGCSSVEDPIGIYDATFTVGAHGSSGTLADFSSRGPVTADGSGRAKPDLTAPGVNVVSAKRGGGFGELNGTSMASPHVAGAVALLWSAAPWLVGDPDMTEQVLLKSATPVFSSLCGEGPEEVSPNLAYGYGRLDVASAVELALDPWELTVTVTDSLGVAVAGAEISWLDARTGYVYTATTGVDGRALITPTLGGEYTLAVQHSAEITSVAGIELAEADVSGSGGTSAFAFTYVANTSEIQQPPIEQQYFLPFMAAPAQQ